MERVRGGGCLVGSDGSLHQESGPPLAFISQGPSVSLCLWPFSPSNAPCFFKERGVTDFTGSFGLRTTTIILTLEILSAPETLASVCFVFLEKISSHDS